MGDAYCLFLIVWTEKQQRALFLSTEQVDIHTNNYLGRDPILFDISFANKSETESNIWFNK